MVACGQQIYNTTPLDTQAGMITQGRTSNYSALGGGTVWNDFASSADFCTRGLGVPGDVGLLAWYPRMDTPSVLESFPVGAPDYSFVPITYFPDTESTSLVVWSQSAEATDLTVVTYSFYEASILPGGEQFTPPNIAPTDSALAMRMIVSAFDAMPPAAIQRNVCKDDGDMQSFVSDAKNVWGGVKGLVNTAKSAWSAFTSLFSAKESPELNACRALIRLSSAGNALIQEELSKHGGDWREMTEHLYLAANKNFRLSRFKARMGSDLEVFREDSNYLTRHEASDEKSSDNEFTLVHRRVVGSGSMTSAATTTPQNTIVGSRVAIR
jgi:hypothetical protein